MVVVTGCDHAVGMIGAMQRMSGSAGSLAVASGKEFGLGRLNCGRRSDAICIIPTFSPRCARSVATGVVMWIRKRTSVELIVRSATVTGGMDALDDGRSVTSPSRLRKPVIVVGSYLSYDAISARRCFLHRLAPPCGHFL